MIKNYCDKATISKIKEAKDPRKYELVMDSIAVISVCIECGAIAKESSVKNLLEHLEEMKELL
jgi:hypothetical protein